MLPHPGRCRTNPRAPTSACSDTRLTVQDVHAHSESSAKVGIPSERSKSGRALRAHFLRTYRTTRGVLVGDSSSPGRCASITSSPNSAKIRLISRSLPWLRVASSTVDLAAPKELFPARVERANSAIARSTSSSSCARSKVPCSPVPCTSHEAPLRAHDHFMSTSALTLLRIEVSLDSPSIHRRSPRQHEA